MNLLGRRTMPCGHHKVLPTVPGEDTRKCDLCKVTHRFIVEQSEVATARCGMPVWRIRWLEVSPVDASNAVESVADTNGARDCANSHRAPEPQTEEAVSDLLGQGSRTVKKPAKARR